MHPHNVTLETRSERSRQHRRLRGPGWLAVILVALAVAGMVSTDEGQLEAAIAEQRARVAISANSTDLNDLANLLVVSGELDEAEAVYRQALSLAPDSIEVSYNLALLLQHREKNREALKLFRSVVKKAPDAAWAHLQIGVISSDLGRRRAAVDAFSKAFSLEPRLASTKVNPHLQQRPEMLEAMLRGNTKSKRAQTAPLSFSDPDRIARLLIGDSAAARAAQRSIERRGLIEPEDSLARTGDSDEAPDLGQRRRAVESLPNSALSEQSRPQRMRGDDEATAMRNPEDEPVSSGAPSQRVRRKPPKVPQQNVEPEKRRVVGVDDLRAVRGSGGTGGSSSSSSRSPSSSRDTRTRQPVSVAPRSRTPVSGGGRSRFRPGARSSARLELRIDALEGASEQTVAASRWASAAPALGG